MKTGTNSPPSNEDAAPDNRADDLPGGPDSALLPAASPGRLVGGFFAFVALLLLGVLAWNQFTNRRAANPAPTPTALADPQALLADTMTRYAAMETFQADYVWRLGSGGDDPTQVGKNGGTSSKRTLRYVRPNKFRVTSDTGGFRLTTVSDGARLAEYASSPTLPGRTYPAPPALASENSPLLQHPMFCATLLHRFFGGPETITSLVDLSKAAVRFGPDAVVGDAPCKTVLFTAQGVYGNAEVAVSTRDGLIRRIRYDSAPLREELEKRAKDQKLPSMATEETYTQLIANKPIPDAAFVTDLPAGVPVAPARTRPRAGSSR